MEEINVKLYDIAHSRSGDKGNISTVSVIAFNADDYPILERYVTAERVAEQFRCQGVTVVERYELPTLGALNFVLHDALDGGVTRSLALDSHGKSLSGLMLEIDITVQPPTGRDGL